MATLLNRLAPLGHHTTRWEQVSIATVAYTVLFLATHLAMRHFSSHYRSGSTRQQTAILARLIGPVHALAVGLPAAELLFSAILAPSWQADWPQSPRHSLQTLSASSMGYMLVDSLVLLPRWDLSMAAHHLLTLSAEYCYVFEFYPQHDFEPMLTVVLLATELTTPFLHASYLMKQYGWHTTAANQPTALSRINTLLLLVTWVGVRLVPFAWFFWVLAMLKLDKLRTMHLGETVHMMTMLLALAFLNVVWFAKLVQLAAKGQFEAQDQEGKRRNQDEAKCNQHKCKDA